MFCKYCGTKKENADDKFCTGCGKTFTVVQGARETGIGQKEIPVPVSPASVSSQPELNELKKIALCKIVLFSCITLGIYLQFWFIKRRDSFNRLISPKKLGPELSTIAIIMFAISVLASIAAFIFARSYMTTARLGLSLLSNLANVVFYVMLLIMSFRCRRILIDHFNGHLKRGIPFSGVATFFFGVLYLQYKINRL